MIRALSALPFPMTAVLNQGCRLEMHGPLPVGEPMQCTAQLVALEREPSKIKITTKITTATRRAGLACTATVYAVIPQKAPRSDSSTGIASAAPQSPRQPAVVPADAAIVSQHGLQGASGRHYAFLSGDFNPIHWIPPLAKMSGFKSCILHGFAQMALVQEDLQRRLGDAIKLKTIDVRFVSPLLLPGTMSVHVSDTTSTVYVTDEMGRVTLVGSFEVQHGIGPSRL